MSAVGDPGGAMRPAFAQAARTGPSPEHGLPYPSSPSRRVSTCWYHLSFEPNSDALDAPARRVIDEAAQEISRTTKRARLLGYRLASEPAELDIRRRDAVGHAFDL